MYNFSDPRWWKKTKNNCVTPPIIDDPRLPAPVENLQVIMIPEGLSECAYLSWDIPNSTQQKYDTYVSVDGSDYIKYYNRLLADNFKICSGIKTYPDLMHAADTIVDFKVFSVNNVGLSQPAHTSCCIVPKLIQITNNLNNIALIVWNTDSAQSEYVKDYYISQRGPNATPTNKFDMIYDLGLAIGNFATYEPYDHEDENAMINANMYESNYWCEIDGEFYHDHLYTQIKQYIDTMPDEEKPGYIMLSKDIYLAIVAEPYRYTTETKLDIDFDHKMSITRLEGRSAYWVKQIIFPKVSPIIISVFPSLSISPTAGVDWMF